MLEVKIRELIARGDLTHFSLVPVGKMWRASYAPSSVFGISVAEDADPIKALMDAFEQPRLKSRKPRDDYSDLGI